MIKSFKHNGLQKFFESGITKGIKVNHAKKLSRMLALCFISKLFLHQRYRDSI